MRAKIILLDAGLCNWCIVPTRIYHTNPIVCGILNFVLGVVNFIYLKFFATTLKIGRNYLIFAIYFCRIQLCRAVVS